MTYETLISEENEHILTLTLNRPESLNSINVQMTVELNQAIDYFQDNEDLRVLVITGKGRAFSPGGDISESLTESTDEMFRLQSFHDVTRKLSRLTKPVIAAVNGPAMGVAMNYALACDMIYASETAKFSEVFINVGLISSVGGTYLLQRALSPCKVREILFTGKIISAQEAYDLGLVNAVVKAEELLPAVYEVAREVAGKPAETLARLKYLLALNANESLENCLYAEMLTQLTCIQSEVHINLVRKFFSKARS
jgi:enoyl-CoA hydratase/carnithine racemase